MILSRPLWMRITGIIEGLHNLCETILAFAEISTSIEISQKQLFFSVSGALIQRLQLFEIKLDTCDLGPQ